VSASLLSSARAGDENAFRELVDPYRRELQLHCYRILGSVQDAEDVLQETLLAAWRGLERFEERASLRAWLYRIATNRSLNALRDRKRRPQEVSTMVEPPEPTRMAERTWLEPYPDVLLEGLPDTAAGPETRYETRESVGLAFVTALQHLPPRQRVALVLRDVLGFDTSETAAILGSSENSVMGALQRGRATLDERLPAGGLERAPLPNSARERELVGLFAAAVESGDTPGIVSLLTDDAWLTMPPEPFEYQGAEAIARFLDDRAARRGAHYRLVATRANGQPAFGCYLPDPHALIVRAYGLMVITLTEDRVSAITWFGERSLLSHFGLPRTLPQ
jgi:RNA polymerase sigma-70 factor (TIGR02960 family)